MNKKLSEIASIVLSGLLLGAFIALVIWVSTEVQEAHDYAKQNGLKGVLNDVWCGKAGCEPTGAGASERASGKGATQ